MKHLILILALSITFLSGCGTTGQNVIPFPLVTSVVASGVSDAILIDPSSKPLLDIAGGVICEQSKGTNVNAADLVSKLESAGVLSASNKVAVAVVNNALFIYDGVFQTYGLSVSNTPVLQGYLGAICSGFQQGEPQNVMARKQAKLLPPHLR